jgi:tRNA-dihydrouridine synthase B
MFFLNILIVSCKFHILVDCLSNKIMVVMKIGPYDIDNPCVLAPMAGVTDLPFRRLCRSLGAGLVVSEMVSSNPNLRHTRKTQLRMNHEGEPGPRSVQIAGADPQWLADCARYNVDQGAQIIDINMGCPAKKVCRKAAGSALLRDEPLVASLLEAVVAAVDVPVTLKIRTGWDVDHKNGVKIAKMAESIGVQALAVHGRTRACGFIGAVDYDSIAMIKHAISIPVMANGDMNTPEQVKAVLAKTGADAVMIGRGAQGRPWIFNQINHFLATGEQLEEPSDSEILAIFVRHMADLVDFYGEVQGVRMARKHVGWFAKPRQHGREFLKIFNGLTTHLTQVSLLEQWLLGYHKITKK